MINVEQAEKILNYLEKINKDIYNILPDGSIIDNPDIIDKINKYINSEDVSKIVINKTEGISVIIEYNSGKPNSTIGRF